MVITTGEWYLQTEHRRAAFAGRCVFHGYVVITDVIVVADGVGLSYYYYLLKKCNAVLFCFCYATILVIIFGDYHTANPKNINKTERKQI